MNRTRKIGITYGILIILNTVLFLEFLYANAYTYMMITVVSLLLLNLVFCLIDHGFHQFFLLIFFQLAFASFLIFRPFLQLCMGGKWWTNLGYSISTSNLTFAVNCLYLALSAMAIVILVFLFVNAGSESRQVNLLHREPKQTEEAIILRRITGFIGLIAMIAYFYKGIINDQFVRESGYLAFYTDQVPQFPIALRALASLYPYMVMIYLTTYPKKKQAYPMMILYVLAEVPNFLLGARGSLIMNLLFCLIYFLIRDGMQSVDQWIGRFEKMMMIVVAPLGIALLGLWNYVREGTSAVSTNIIWLIRDFFYRQGVSFCTVACADSVMTTVKSSPHDSYLFGGILDYWKQCSLSQILFGCKRIPNGNSIQMATESNSLSHRISYLLDPASYLQGHGYGSSYLLDAYADLGYIGVFMASLIIAVILVICLRWIGRWRITDVAIFYSLSILFFMPRDTFSRFFDFLLKEKIWISLMICLSMTWGIKKMKMMKKRRAGI